MPKVTEIKRKREQKAQALTIGRLRGGPFRFESVLNSARRIIA